MRGGEAKFWREMKDKIRLIGDVDRIESHETSIGRPDINICIEGDIQWDIELKYTDTHGIEVRPSQRMWFKKRSKVQRRACFFTKVVRPNEILYLVNLINNTPDSNNLSDWILCARAIYNDNIDWEHFEEILRNE